MQLIDKKAALKAIYLAGELINKYGGRFYEGKFYGCQSAYEIIKDMPTVEERKHGHWIEHPEHPIGDCSVCGERVPIYSGSKKYKICPSCVAFLVNPNEHTKVRKINSFIKTNHLENAYE